MSESRGSQLVIWLLVCLVLTAAVFFLAELLLPFETFTPFRDFLGWRSMCGWTANGIFAAMPSFAMR